MLTKITKKRKKKNHKRKQKKNTEKKQNKITISQICCWGLRWFVA